MPSAELTEEQIETVNGYMALVENLLGNGNLGSAKYESDREDYAVKEVITYGDLQGNDVYRYTSGEKIKDMHKRYQKMVNGRR